MGLRRARIMREFQKKAFQKAWAIESERLSIRVKTNTGEATRDDNDEQARSVFTEALRAMPTSTTAGFIGIKIARQVRVVRVYNCNTAEVADLRLREAAYRAGADGIINLKVRSQPDGKYWAEGDSVLVAGNLETSVLRGDRQLKEPNESRRLDPELSVVMDKEPHKCNDLPRG